MANNYLITGYWGEPHVTPENDRGFNAAIFGPGRFVLPVGEQLRAEYIGNNTVRVHDGKLLNNGALAGIPAGNYVDLLIPEASQGMNRSDLIVFEYRKDPSTLVETGEFKVLAGTESTGTAYDPALTQQDLLTDEATIDQMALWRVSVSGAVISAPAQMFDVRHPGGGVDLLWRNPDTTAAFKNQTVGVDKDLRRYSTIFIGFRRKTEDSGDHLEWVTLVNAHPYATRSVYRVFANGMVYSRFVMVYVSPMGLYFNSTSYETVIGGSISGIDPNTLCVPVVAYGLHGTVNL